LVVLVVVLVLVVLLLLRSKALLKVGPKGLSLRKPKKGLMRNVKGGLQAGHCQ